MKIESVRIKNLRSFRDETINFNDYTCLVGPNGSGKSTVLYALNIFFHEKSGVSTDTANLDKEDFHNKNTDEPIEITITFVGLSEEAQIDFSNYYRQGKLIVSAVAVYDQAIGKAPVRQVGKRLVMPAFKEFFKALGNSANVPELTELYNNIREHINLPIPGTKTKMIDALHQYENEHPELCELLDSDDQFYGVTKGANKLEKYLQWVYVPAVKDASGEQIETKNTALGRLLARTVRSKANFSDSVSRIEENAHSQYQRLLDENQYILNDLSQSLKRRLSDWAHPEAMVKLEWWRDPDKSVKIEEPFAKIIAGEGAFEGELARFGHGLQRSYLLALLHELASVEDVVDSQLILGCEEPELYQHPPQARHLSTVLQKLSNGNAQIIVATHSPAFVSGDGFENVRMVRKNTENRRSNVFGANYSNICADIAEATGETPRSVSGTIAKIHQVLQPALNEMFFTSRLVLVEGLEDVAYLSAYLHLLDRWEDFRRIGCHFVPTNGKSELVRPLVIARRLKIPTYCHVP